MERFICYTLVDITNTKNTQSTDSKERNQQRNLETLIQVIGIRAQPFITSEVTSEVLNTDMFGNLSENRVWSFTFESEHDGVYSFADSVTGLLDKDVNNVPINVGLDETVSFRKNVFSTNESSRNIIFRPAINIR